MAPFALITRVLILAFEYVHGYDKNFNVLKEFLVRNYMQLFVSRKSID